MNWMMIDTWTVIAGMLSALSCALLGNFLVLRRMSLMGDAISHAVLPGLAIAFFVTGSRDSFPMFLGASVVGVATAVFTQWISHFGKVEEGAAMGVVFTTLFAIGLILIVHAADHVDLDPGCVLYGTLALTPLNTTPVWGFDVPRVVVSLGAVLALNTITVSLLYKEFKISAFDPDLSTTLGIHSGLMHYLLMSLVAVTTVASFESVGSILVIAMLIVPGAAAFMFTDRLPVMIGLSLVIAVLCAGFGHLGAIVVPGWFGFEGTSTSSAGMMAVVAGIVFVMAVIAAPQYGIVTKFAHRWQISMTILREDILGLIYRLEEHDVTGPTVVPGMLKDAMGINQLYSKLSLWSLARAGQLRREDDGAYRITSEGRDSARLLVRSHRLWETYLHHHLHLAPDHVHPTAEQLEHITDARMREELEVDTDQPSKDPHGRKIPRR